MQIIAHRALLQGPNPSLENSPTAIEIAINQGFMVEVDINTEQYFRQGDFPTSFAAATPESAMPGTYFGEDRDFVLGHEGGPHYGVSLDYVIEIAPYTYFHAKDLKVFNHLLHLRCIPYLFFHNTDDGVLTTNGKIWTYPKKELFGNSIAVLPETWYPDKNLEANLEAMKDLNCWGVCTDWAWYARKTLT